MSVPYRTVLYPPSTAYFRTVPYRTRVCVCVKGRKSCKIVCVCAVSKHYKKYGLASTCLQTTVPYRTVLESTAYRTVLTYRTHAYLKNILDLIKLLFWNLF